MNVAETAFQVLSSSRLNMRDQNHACCTTSTCKVGTTHRNGRFRSPKFLIRFMSRHGKSSKSTANCASWAKSAHREPDRGIGSRGFQPAAADQPFSRIVGHKGDPLDLLADHQC